MHIYIQDILDDYVFPTIRCFGFIFRKYSQWFCCHIYFYFLPAALHVLRKYITKPRHYLYYFLTVSYPCSLWKVYFVWRWTSIRYLCVRHELFYYVVLCSFLLILWKTLCEEVRTWLVVVFVTSPARWRPFLLQVPSGALLVFLVLHLLLHMQISEMVFITCLYFFLNDIPYVCCE